MTKMRNVNMFGIVSIRANKSNTTSSSSKYKNNKTNFHQREQPFSSYFFFVYLPANDPILFYLHIFCIYGKCNKSRASNKNTFHINNSIAVFCLLFLAMLRNGRSTAYENTVWWPSNNEFFRRAFCAR